jgi:hypothetical protein
MMTPYFVFFVYFVLSVAPSLVVNDAPSLVVNENNQSRSHEVLHNSVRLRNGTARPSQDYRSNASVLAYWNQILTGRYA